MRVGLLFLSALAAAMAHADPSLKQAAALYHQGRYDSALAVLGTCRTHPLKHRDSLALFQYSGMASARLGRSEEASGDFRALLDLDSLFQFPRNEDGAVLAAFAEAQTARAGSVNAAPAMRIDSSADRSPPPPPAPAQTAMALPVSAAVPPGGLVPIPDYSGSGSPSGHAPAAFPANAGNPGAPGIGLAMGAIPLGGGWLFRGRRKQGLTLALLQAGGLAFSFYASSQMTAAERDSDGISHGELGSVDKWQWTQRVTLSVALGAYLFSLIASKGD